MNKPIPHGLPAKQFIDWVNMFTPDEAKRCRILLAELLLRSEKQPIEDKPEEEIDKLDYKYQEYGLKQIGEIIDLSPYFGKINELVEVVNQLKGRK